MAEITRKVGDVRPNNYVRPGVQKPSPMTLAAQLGSQAIDLDAQLASERMREDADSLRAEYEMGSPASIAVQEGAAALAPGDQKQVDALKGELATHESAVAQGRMSYDQYRVRGERMLRLAISKRPGLAQELRAVAALHLGTDVVGASVDVLASWEKQMLAAQGKGKEEEAKPDYKRMRDQLDSVGIVNAHLTDEQIAAEYPSHIHAIRERLKLDAEESIVTDQVGIQKGGQELNRPSATSQFVTQAKQAKLKLYDVFNKAAMAFRANAFTPEQIASVITNGKAEVASTISDLRSAMAAGDVDASIAEKEIASLEALQGTMEQLADGSLDNKARTNKVEGMILYMQHGMLDNENVSSLAAATKTFGPELMAQFVGPGGSFNKTAAVALGDTLNNTGRPATRAAHAGVVASSLIRSVLDRGGAKSNPEMVPKMFETLTTAANSFVEIEPKDFKSDHLTGPNGYITVLHAHRESLKKALPEKSTELLGAVSIAALSNYHALAQDLGRRYGGLHKKLDFTLDHTTGEFVHPKPGVKLSPTEAAAVRQYNKAFDGKRVLDLFSTLAGVDSKAARNLLMSGQPVYEETKKALKAERQAQEKAAKVAAASGAWWENF